MGFSAERWNKPCTSVSNGMLSNSNIRPTVLALILASAFLVGCASTSNHSSGFLDGYAHLEQDPQYPRGLVYKRPKWKETEYTGVLIEPTVVRLNAKDQKKLTNKETADLAAYSEAALRKAFKKELKIVTAAEPATLRIRSAITGVDTSNLSVNIVTGVLLWPVDYGGVSVEYDVRDATTNEQVVALVGFSNGTPVQVISSFSRFGHAHGGIDHWSFELLKLVNREHP
jgi:hypothetical protein